MNASQTYNPPLQPLEVDFVTDLVGVVGNFKEYSSGTESLLNPGCSVWEPLAQSDCDNLSGPPRLGFDPQSDRRNALLLICRLVLEVAHRAHRPGEQ